MVNPANPERALKRLQRLAWVMDSAIRIPGTRWRVGIDALLGLAPGIGDALAGLVSAYVLIEAWRLGVPGWTLTRMAANLLVDLGIGSIPVAGDIFDAGFRANRRNVELIRRAMHGHRQR